VQRRRPVLGRTARISGTKTLPKVHALGRIVVVAYRSCVDGRTGIARRCWATLPAAPYSMTWVR
jgi:hypothetical protein